MNVKKSYSNGADRKLIRQIDIFRTGKTERSSIATLNVL